MARAAPPRATVATAAVRRRRRRVFVIFEGGRLQPRDRLRGRAPPSLVRVTAGFGFADERLGLDRALRPLIGGAGQNEWIEDGVAAFTPFRARTAATRFSIGRSWVAFRERRLHRARMAFGSGKHDVLLGRLVRRRLA